MAGVWACVSRVAPETQKPWRRGPPSCPLTDVELQKEEHKQSFRCMARRLSVDVTCTATCTASANLLRGRKANPQNDASWHDDAAAGNGAASVANRAICGAHRHRATCRCRDGASRDCRLTRAGGSRDRHGECGTAMPRLRARLRAHDYKHDDGAILPVRGLQ